MATPTIAVVLPARDDGDELRACLDALAASDPPPDEVIIAVDGAEPAVVELAEAHADTVVPVRPSRGPTHARNAAARAASADLVLFIAPDVAVHPDTVERARAAFIAVPQADAVIGSYDDAPRSPGLLSRYRHLRDHWVHQHAGRAPDTFWRPCGAIRRGTFLELGGFDAERYPTASVEDVELGHRLTASGGQILLDPGVQVTALRSWDLRGLLRCDVLAGALPRSELMLARGRIRPDRSDVAWHSATKGVLAGLLLIGLVLAPWVRQGLLVGAAAMLGLLVMDWPLIRFFGRKHGPVFTTGAIGWHWLSYLFGGMAFAVAVVRHLTSYLRDDVRST